MMTPKTAFLIAAPTSGSGKTTIARGLMALFTGKDYKVQPFKCGPDYIDTKFHEAVCGRPSINLDTFMATPEHVRYLFDHVVLVVDAKSAAYSMAPLLSGFIHFRKDVCIRGVIYNKVGSERHFEMLRQVCDDLGVECLGYLPKSPILEQGSRYLGLDFSEKAESKELIELLENDVRWQRLLEL